MGYLVIVSLLFGQCIVAWLPWFQLSPWPWCLDALDAGRASASCNVLVSRTLHNACLFTYSLSSMCRAAPSYGKVSCMKFRLYQLRHAYWMRILIHLPVVSWIMHLAPCIKHKVFQGPG